MCSSDLACWDPATSTWSVLGSGVGGTEPCVYALTALDGRLYAGGRFTTAGGVSAKDIDEKGAVVVWPATDTRGLPPASIREQFPNVVPEVPRAFERRFQGRLPLIRIGWAVIRPRAQVAPPAR